MRDYCGGGISHFHPDAEKNEKYPILLCSGLDQE
jgi:hypothetical protein